MVKRTMRDPIYQPHAEFVEQRGSISLGLLKSREWIVDPRRFMFSQSRYKFVAMMLSGRRRVLEIGCGDAFNAPIVLQEVERLTVTDIDPEFVENAKLGMQPEYPYEALVHDFLRAPMDRKFDAAYALDVLEHIDSREEDLFLGNTAASLEEHGVLIIGMPSLESQTYASPGSKAGHINCKSGPDLKKVMERFFHAVFMFSMNDEVVHTGYQKMAHYLFALCADQK